MTEATKAVKIAKIVSLIGGAALLAATLIGAWIFDRPNSAVFWVIAIAMTLTSIALEGLAVRLIIGTIRGER